MLSVNSVKHQAQTNVQFQGATTKAVTKMCQNALSNPKVVQPFQALKITVQNYMAQLPAILPMLSKL